MTHDVILVEERDLVATIILNRPEKHNSLTPQMLLKLAGVFDELALTDDIRAVVIRGQGDKAFSSGYDISELPTGMQAGPAGEIAEKNPLQACLCTIEQYPYPVIAMIDGYAYGAGCELAMTCDIRIASHTSRMGMPPSRLGLVYPAQAIQRFIDVMGFTRAKEAFLTGRYYDIDQACQMGMVNYVVEKDRLHAFTRELAEELACNAPLAIKGHKRIFSILREKNRLADRDREEVERIILHSLGSEDLAEGAAAFLEKRRPRFTGR